MASGDDRGASLTILPGAEVRGISYLDVCVKTYMQGTAEGECMAHNFLQPACDYDKSTLLSKSDGEIARAVEESVLPIMPLDAIFADITYDVNGHMIGAGAALLQYKIRRDLPDEPHLHFERAVRWRAALEYHLF